MNQHERMHVRNSAGACPAFQWIGQTLDHCDACGHPYWEHTHEDVGRRPGPFAKLRRHRRLIPRSWARKASRRYMAEETP